MSTAKRPHIPRPGSTPGLRTFTRLRDAAVVGISTRRSRCRAAPLARQIAARRAGTVAMAAAVVLMVLSTVRGATAARAEWGSTVQVIVADVTVRPGEELSRESFSRIRVPRFAAPRAAIDKLPHDLRARRSIGPGEIVVKADVSTRGTSAMAAALPDGTSAVAVPLGMTSTPLEMGDRVDIYGLTGQPGAPVEVQGPDVADSVDVLTRNALVMAQSDGQVTVAVRHEDVEATVGAALNGLVNVVLVG